MIIVKTSIINVFKRGDIIILKIERSENDKFIILLFLCIMVSLTPILISSVIIPGFDSHSLFNIVVGCMFAIQVIIIFFYYIKNSSKTINNRFLIFAWLYMITQTITIFVALLSGRQVNYYDFINIFARTLSVFIFACIPSKLKITKNNLDVFMSMIVILGTVACIYNIIINFRGISSVLYINNAYEVNYKSFYLNRNSFAQLLYISMIANTVLFYKDKTFYNWLCYILFGINMITSLSRTAILSIIIFIFILFINFLVKKPMYLLSLITILGILIRYVFLNPILYNFMTNILLRGNMGTNGRSSLWNIGFKVLNETSWFFGTGYFTSIQFIEKLGFDLEEFHSFYIETLVGGGIFDLLLIFSIFIFMIKRIKRIYTYSKEIGLILISAYISLMIYSLFESSSFFTMGYVGSLFTIFFITVPLLYSNNLIEKNVCNV